MINGGFKNKYNDDEDINKFLKDFELEIRNIQNKFYKIDNRFDDKTIFNYKGKSLSRIILELENKILQVMIDFSKFKNIQLYTLEYDGLKIIDKPDNKYFSIKQLEYVIFLKTEINMKLEIKEIKDEFPEYKTNSNTDNLPNNKIIIKNNKVIHHDHCTFRHLGSCSRLRCTFLSSPKLVYIGELYFCIIQQYSAQIIRRIIKKTKKDKSRLILNNKSTSLFCCISFAFNSN